jgi:hypothetical protein
MPYSLGDLPKGVEKYSEHCQHVWLAVWNSSQERGDDESTSFAKAYGVANDCEGRTPVPPRHPTELSHIESLLRIAEREPGLIGDPDRLLARRRLVMEVESSVDLQFLDNALGELKAEDLAYRAICDARALIRSLASAMGREERHQGRDEYGRFSSNDGEPPDNTPPSDPWQTSGPNSGSGGGSGGGGTVSEGLQKRADAATTKIDSLVGLRERHGIDWTSIADGADRPKVKDLLDRSASSLRGAGQALGTGTVDSIHSASASVGSAESAVGQAERLIGHTGGLPNEFYSYSGGINRLSAELSVLAADARHEQSDRRRKEEQDNESAGDQQARLNALRAQEY